MRQVIKHREIRLLNMIRRTNPVIPNGNTGQNGAVWFYHSLSHSLHPVLVIGVNDGVVMS